MTAKIALVEVFRSVQGEGYHTGRPAIFVRLAGCPLACEFAPGVVCDTPYQQANLKLTLDELFYKYVADLCAGYWDVSRARKAHDPQAAPMMIFTGGEPTAAPAFDDLVVLANQMGFYTAVETNGTRWRDGLMWLDWISVSPKEHVPQTSKAPHHNHNPQSPTLLMAVCDQMGNRQKRSGEYRYVVNGADMVPPFLPAFRHYVSPAIKSNGSGDEWKTGWPGFAPGAFERCLQIVTEDPRWRISLQTHKVTGVR